MTINLSESVTFSGTGTDRTATFRWDSDGISGQVRDPDSTVEIPADTVCNPGVFTVTFTSPMPGTSGFHASQRVITVLGGTGEG